MKWSARVFWMLVGIVVTLILLSLAGCVEPAGEVHCDCPEYTREITAFERCIGNGRDPQDCLDLFRMDMENSRQAWLDVVEGDLADEYDW